MFAESVSFTERAFAALRRSRKRLTRSVPDIGVLSNNSRYNFHAEAEIFNLFNFTLIGYYFELEISSKSHLLLFKLIGLNEFCK